MKRKEDPITRGIIKYIRSLPKGWAVKTHGGMFSAGEPDISGCLDGRCIKFEVKRDGKHEATDLQKAKILQWTLAGAITGVVWSVDQVKDILRAWGYAAP
jgi:hypothetical protein